MEKFKKGSFISMVRPTSTIMELIHKITIFKEENHVSLNWLKCGFPILMELEFGDDFVEEGKTENAERNPGGMVGTNNIRNRAW